MKIVTIGAGSVAWGPRISIDFLLNPALDGAELMLMDVDAEKVELVRRLLERLVDEQGFAKRVRATTDLREALTDADYVLTAISVGGDRLWRYDAMFPQIYGIFQPVGDTIGPGGLVRALRHAPALLKIGRTMLEVSKPNAPLIQLTNPMNPLCAALERLDGLTVYGICHGIDDTAAIVTEMHGVPKAEVEVVAAGNNHHIYCTEIRVGDEVYDQARIDELAPSLFDTPFRAEVYRRYGGFVGNHSRHPIEFLPGFLTQEHGFGRAWGVPPLAVQIDPMLGERQDGARDLLLRALAQLEPISFDSPHVHGGLSLDDEGRVQTRHSHERIDEFIVALDRGLPYSIHLNVPNDGAIAGVPPDHHVEVPVDFVDGELRRRSLQFNEKITAEIARVGEEQKLIADACVAFDRDTLVEALSLDALVPNREIATRLVDEMVAFQREYVFPEAGD
jgi:alpha-galactosidase